MKVRKPTKLLAEARESCLMAMNAIAAHKLRSSLTLLGVLVGVFSIIVTMTAMRVLKSNIERQISRLGVNSFSLRKGPSVYFGDSAGFEKFWRRKNLTLAQGRQVEERATLAASVGIEGNFWAGQVETRFSKTIPSVQMLGETPGSFPARGWTVEDGRGLTEADVENARDVCVIGHALAQNGFPYGSPLGERVKLNGINYTVIGVLASKGTSRNEQQDMFAIVPITTALNRGGRWFRSLTILVQAHDRESYEETVDQARGILRVARKVAPGAEDDFEIASNDSMVAQFNTFTRTVRIGVAVVSSIALIAAGIGIMNIMLVSVTERTREIGIRRAIGAKKRNIMTQFIVEAVVLCQVGGVIGVVLGILGGNAVAFFMKVPPAIPVDWIILGMAICSAVGVVFGTYPAFKAANLDPIESLRYE
jgi:putative ABC transport system permease protein